MSNNEILVLVNYFDLENQLAEEYVPCKLVSEQKMICELIFPPFFVPNLAQGDRIKIDFHQDNVAVWQDTVLASGNSTIHVVELSENGLENLLDKLEERNYLDIVRYKSERYIALNIPKDFEYAVVQKILLDFQQCGAIDFQESCLSEKHYNENIQKV